MSFILSQLTYNIIVMNKEDRLQRALADRIEAPKNQQCRPSVEGFGDLLASSVLSVNPHVSTFRESLDCIITTRLDLAVKGNDFNTVKTLMLFEESRAKGKTLPGLRGQSVSIIHKNGRYNRLFEMLYSGYFKKSKLPFTHSHTIPEIGFWTQKIEYNPAATAITIHHAGDADVPAILNYLEILWRSVLSPDSCKNAVADLASFEWWFFISNITGLAAASIGNCLSLILQIALDVSLSDKFENNDWHALSMSHDKYLKWRLRKIKSRFSPL